MSTKIKCCQTPGAGDSTVAPCADRCSAGTLGVTDGEALRPATAVNPHQIHIVGIGLDLWSRAKIRARERMYKKKEKEVYIYICVVSWLWGKGGGKEEGEGRERRGQGGPKSLYFLQKTNHFDQKLVFP